MGLQYQAKVTFTALNNKSNLPERHITLYPHLQTIQVGRASKTPSKNLQPADDNAWFDSPVVSRAHAEMSLNSEKQVVTMKDIGSMHGTFVNKSQLHHFEPRTLNNGDLIVFGAPVKRNNEIFPACAFIINYELLPYKAEVSYAFPGSDEDEEEISEDDGRENTSSEDGMSVESPSQKVSQAINAIDLTRDESPIISEAKHMSESSTENVLEVSPSRPTENNLKVDLIKLTSCGTHPPILVNSDDEDSHYSSDSNDQSEFEYQDDCLSAGHAYTAEETVAQDREQDDNDTESNYKLSNAAAEGSRALLEDGLLNKGDADREGFEMGDEESTRQDVATFARFPTHSSPEVTPAFPHLITLAHACLESSASESLPNVRQPSPSDAAMVKTAVPSATPLRRMTNSVDVHHLPSEDFSNFAAQSLGEESGKHELFAAREDNRVKVFDRARPIREISSLLPTANVENKEHSRISTERFRERRQSLGMTESNMVESLTTQRPMMGPVDYTTLYPVSYPDRSYLDDHAQAPDALTPTDPEPDMTSAFTYNESKASLTFAKALSLKRSGCCGSTVPNTSECTAENKSTTLKRKASDLSDSIEEEIRVWASSSPPSIESVTLGDINTSSADGVCGKKFLATSMPVVTKPENRPAKRLRKIAESVGFVALGGATLFGALVLTAPNFA